VWNTLWNALEADKKVDTCALNPSLHEIIMITGFSERNSSNVRSRSCHSLMGTERMKLGFKEMVTRRSVLLRVIVLSVSAIHFTSGRFHLNSTDTSSVALERSSIRGASSKMTGSST